MPLRRTCTQWRRCGVHAAVTKKLDEALELLEGHLPLLTDKQRATVPRVRADFPKAARSLAEASEEHPEFVAATEFEAEAVTEDLDNVEALEQLERRVERMQQLTADAKLLWTAEAYVPSLELYGVAKVGAKKNAKLAAAIAPLAEVFATPRKQTLKTP